MNTSHPMYTWTTRNGITVTSQVPPRTYTHDRHPALHIVWSYSHWVRVLTTGYAELIYRTIQNTLITGGTR